jgi:YidC/Oxa1 family membrane protein insertase
MEVWTNFVDLIFTTLVGLSTILGGNMGLAIGVLSFSIRLALLPLTLRLAHRALDVQTALKKLEPELAKIRKTYKDDPKRIWEETARLHQEKGIKVLQGSSILGMLVQAPLFLGLFAAVQRGLSKDLLKSDPLLACLCAALTGLSVALGSNIPESQRAMAIVLPAGLTLLFLWRMGSGVAIYSLSSSLVGVLQSLIIRRRLATG